MPTSTSAQRPQCYYITFACEVAGVEAGIPLYRSDFQPSLFRGIISYKQWKYLSRIAVLTLFP